MNRAPGVWESQGLSEPVPGYEGYEFSILDGSDTPLGGGDMGRRLCVSVFRPDGRLALGVFSAAAAEDRESTIVHLKVRALERLRANDYESGLFYTE